MNVLAKQKYLFIILLIGISVRVGVKDNIWAKNNTSYEYTIIKDSIEIYLLDKDNPVNQWTSSVIDSKELEYFSLPSDKLLEVFVTEAVNMNDKISNSIGIKLRLILNEQEKKVGNILIEGSKEVRSLGDITMTRNQTEPYWKLSDNEQVIGVGTKGLSIPSKLYQFIPNNIRTKLYYSIEEYEVDSLLLNFYITFIDIDNLYKEEIKLDQIGLPKEHYNKLNHDKDKNLHFVANYDFSLPIAIVMEDEGISLKLEEEKDPNIDIKGVLPLQKDIKVR